MKLVSKIAELLGINEDQVAQAMGVENTSDLTLFTSGIVGFLGFGPKIEREIAVVDGKLVQGPPTMSGVQISEEAFQKLTRQ